MGGMMHERVVNPTSLRQNDASEVLDLPDGAQAVFENPRSDAAIRIQVAAGVRALQGQVRFRRHARQGFRLGGGSTRRQFYQHMEPSFEGAQGLLVMQAGGRCDDGRAGAIQGRIEIGRGVFYPMGGSERSRLFDSGTANAGDRNSGRPQAGGMNRGYAAAAHDHDPHGGASSDQSGCFRGSKRGGSSFRLYV